ncbi:MAG: PIN domain-containing protein [Actinomycetota bacterium]|nr:PIN domain-containing protein [Actinomycetota bacterium]
MAVVVFDADVLIAYLGRDDANHVQAVERMRKALEPGTRRLVSAVNYTEVLIGPLQHAGRAGAETVDAMLVRFGIETIQVDLALARRGAAVRVRTRLKLPDAYALATAIHAEKHGHGDVRLESFDSKVIKAYTALHPIPPELD